MMEIMYYLDNIFGDIIRDLMSHDDPIYRFNHFFQLLGITMSIWIGYSLFYFIGEAEYARDKRKSLDNRIRLFGKHMIILHTLFLSIGLTMTAGAFSKKRLIRLINELSIMLTFGEIFYIYNLILPYLVDKSTNNIKSTNKIDKNFVLYFSCILTSIFTLLHIYLRSVPFYAYMLAFLFIMTASVSNLCCYDFCTELFRLYKYACLAIGIAIYFYIVQFYITQSLQDITSIKIGSFYLQKAKLNYMNILWVLNLVIGINLLIQHMKACFAKILNLAINVVPNKQYSLIPRVDLIIGQ